MYFHVCILVSTWGYPYLTSASKIIRGMLLCTGSVIQVKKLGDSKRDLLV
jgi:hypothetical protein